MKTRIDAAPAVKGLSKPTDKQTRQTNKQINTNKHMIFPMPVTGNVISRQLFFTTSSKQ